MESKPAVVITSHCQLDVGALT